MLFLYPLPHAQTIIKVSLHLSLPPSPVLHRLVLWSSADGPSDVSTNCGLLKEVSYQTAFNFWSGRRQNKKRANWRRGGWRRRKGKGSWVEKDRRRPFQVDTCWGISPTWLLQCKLLPTWCSVRRRGIWPVYGEEESGQCTEKRNLASVRRRGIWPVTMTVWCR